MNIINLLFTLCGLLLEFLQQQKKMDIGEVFKLFEQNAISFTKCFENDNCNVLDGIFGVYHTMHDIMTNYFNCVIMEDDVPSFGIYDWEEGILIDMD